MGRGGKRPGSGRKKRPSLRFKKREELSSLLETLQEWPKERDGRKYGRSVDTENDRKALALSIRIARGESLADIIRQESKNDRRDTFTEAYDTAKHQIAARERRRRENEPTCIWPVVFFDPADFPFIFRTPTSHRLASDNTGSTAPAQDPPSHTAQLEVHNPRRR